MLGLMAVLFYIQSAAFLEDSQDGEDKASSKQEALNSIQHRYEAATRNCWVAACIYAVTMIISFQQYCANRKRRT